MTLMAGRFAGIAAEIRVFREHLQDRLYRNAILLVVNSALVTGSGAMFWLLVARHSEPAEVGLASGLIGSLMFISMFAKLGLDTSLLKLLPESSAPERAFFVRVSLAAVAAASVVGAVTFALGTRLWAPVLTVELHQAENVAAFVALTAIWSFGLILDSILLAGGRTGLMLGKNTVQAIAKVALALAIPMMDSEAIVAASVGTMVLGLLFVAASPTFKLIPRSHGRRPAGGARRLVSSSATNYVVSLLIAAPAMVGPIVVIERFGPSDAASFYILWMIGSIGMLAPVAFGQASLVAMAERGGVLPIPLRALILSMLVGLATIIGAAIVLPLLGPHYSAISLVGSLPYALAVLPGFIFQAKLAQFRATDASSIQIVACAVQLGGFVIGLVLIPSAAVAGWAWFGALAAAAMVSLLVRR